MQPRSVRGVEADSGRVDQVPEHRMHAGVDQALGGEGDEERGVLGPGHQPFAQPAVLSQRVRGAALQRDQPGLVIVDDIGLLPVSPDAAEGFYRLVDAAYERRALAVSSNLHPSGFDEIMPKTLATATVDRLLHHAHVVVTQGDSFRLNQATSGQGVIPLR